MRLFDLHCDTPLCLYEGGLSLSENSLHIDIKKTAPYGSFIQTGAFWANSHLGAEQAWEHFLRAYAAFLRQIDETPDTVLVTDAAGIREAAASGKRAFLPAVEDARILNGYISRLDTLRDMGVRILTLCWGGKTCIGGSHDTDAPLTDFGRAVVRRCFELGIVPDISHASRAVSAEVLAMAQAAGRPVIASHSNAFAVRAHSRNLTDDEFRAVMASGGLAGISMVPYHLTDGTCDFSTLAAHIAHYLRLGGENSLCLGCDFDGVSELPAGIENVSSLPRLADHLRGHGMSEEQIDRIFFQNAYDFAMRNL